MRWYHNLPKNAKVEAVRVSQPCHYSEQGIVYAFFQDSDGYPRIEKFDEDGFSMNYGSLFYLCESVEDVKHEIYRYHNQPYAARELVKC